MEAIHISAEQAAYRFDSRLRRLDTPKACADLFRNAIAPFEFDAFACGVVDLEHRERHVFYLMDWPDEWRSFYIRSGLIDRDPVIDALAVRQQPFTWTDLRKDRKFDRVGRESLRRSAAAGWSEGLVVPLPVAPRRVGLISLVGHQSAMRLEDRAYLCLISLCLFTRVRVMVAECGFAVAPVGLTPREIASVKLVAVGHTDGQVGKALGVAASTAHEFVEKAKRKLKTHSRAELVAVAASLGIINV
jgi:LuxR family quorum sensing-dependent transcriptional regulator